MKKKTKTVSAPDIRIAVLGSISRGIVARASRLPEAGEMVSGTGLSMFTGGRGAVQAAQAALLGAEVFFIGCTGDDEHAPSLTQSLAEKGVRTELLLWMEGEQTGNCSIFEDETSRSMTICYAGTNQMVSRRHIDNATKIIKSSDLFLAQLEVNVDAVERGLQIAREAGVTTLLNPAPATPLPDDIFQLVDFITISEADCEAYTGLPHGGMPSDEWKNKIARWFLSRGVRGVCINLGENGAYYLDGKSEVFAPAYEAAAAGAGAADDAFSAGYACALAAKWDSLRALGMANACGQLTSPGPVSLDSLAARPEVDALMETRK